MWLLKISLKDDAKVLSVIKVFLKGRGRRGHMEEGKRVYSRGRRGHMGVGNDIVQNVSLFSF